MGGGYSFRLGERQKSPYPQIDQALKDLMQGFNFDADVQLFFNQNSGAGINTNYFKTSTSVISIKQTFWYIGASYVYKDDINNNFSVIYNIGIGLLFSKESSDADYDYTKTAFALNAGVNGEYKINQYLGVGLKLSCTVGSVGSLNYLGSSYELNERMSVSSIGISGFLSFRAR